MCKVINGIQQIGIGVADVKEVFNWYRRYLGFDILVFKDENSASLMTRYTNHKVEDRIAYLSLNMAGGGGLEIWQFKNRVPQALDKDISLGDLGIHIMKLRTDAISVTHQRLQTLSLSLLSEIYQKESQSPFFYFKDPWGNAVQVVQDTYRYANTKVNCGGVLGAVLGVSNIDVSIEFYHKLLGYDIVVFDEKKVFKDFENFSNGAEKFRRVLLKRSCVKKGGFGALLGPSEIELVQSMHRKPEKIFKNRLWGDLGYIHLCFDLRGMTQHRADAQSIGFPFTVDSAESFDMGDAAGHFSYVEDPDGTLLEFVETHKVPIIKKLGVSIEMKKRSTVKPLPRWLVKSLKIHRVKKDL